MFGLAKNLVYIVTINSGSLQIYMILEFIEVIFRNTHTTVMKVAAHKQNIYFVEV